MQDTSTPLGSIPQNHPTLILIRGLPGSGKSYLADALRTALGTDNVAVVDPDATDYTSDAYKQMSAALTAEGVDEKFHPYRFTRAQAYDGITSNKIIMWNQAFTNLDGFNKTVVNLQTYASDHGTTLPLLVVEVNVDPDVAKARVAERVAAGGHDVNEEAWTRFIADYGTFAEHYNTVAVDGGDDVAASVDTVIRALHQLWQQDTQA